MAKKQELSRRQALDARPLPAEIADRVPLPDGGQRITVLFAASGYQRWLLRLPERVKRDFELDAFGVEILGLCDGSRTVLDIIKKFTARHKLDPTEAEHAVLAFLKTLVRRGVVAMAVHHRDEKKK